MNQPGVTSKERPFFNNVGVFFKERDLFPTPVLFTPKQPSSITRAPPADRASGASRLFQLPEILRIARLAQTPAAEFRHVG